MNLGVKTKRKEEKERENEVKILICIARNQITANNSKYVKKNSIQYSEVLCKL